MLLALEFFRVGELLAGGCDLVLRLDMRGIRSGRFGIRLAGAEAAPDPADLQAGGKAFEVAFLLVGKVDYERFDFHARRNSCGHDWWRQRNGMDRPGNRLGCVLPGDDFAMRSDQLRCCGNPSWTLVGRHLWRADCTAPFKLHARGLRR